ncbi:ParB/RepB/Spo0J family partition protein [Sinanaerobacter chloroacetimidivorans]|jgi:ParB family chromosome partitioning protein|uniref:ParB/RepB/Spo0J family partition protein n=1 Tax=Sinanaerobacter chloroacetimidivorans TaxID=2818044 RepID=A0A8J7W3U4_9FIRM|nr:ParB/RepB/Spo0J family partition protein [Sinanaerobacter chloroacetimidivorans]MBR0598430.1 ParB/RepB/Spo0J family partition protein [Sinanaerobacter chloroacetimidivorans]
MFLKKADHLELPIEMISANPDQPRKIFDDKELMELCDSIKEFGIIQPIIVKKDLRGAYLLIAGERRLRAAGLAGLKKVPVIIREADEKDSALLALVENVQRENLNYIEEAVAYKRLMEDYGLTQNEIARRVGKQQSTISNKIRLLSLPRDIQAVLSENQLTERHARALLKLSDEKVRKQILGRIVEHGLNVKQTEKLIEDVLAKQEEEKRKGEKLRFINYRIYLNTLKKAFSSINDVEKNAKYFQEDKGDYLEVRIIIPKNETKPNIALAD